MCDPTGPLFDHSYTKDPKLSANNVQCIHTTVNYGTSIYNCHQDWRMGNCGISQPGAPQFLYSSH